jgi:hypothetical protein
MIEELSNYAYVSSDSALSAILSLKPFFQLGRGKTSILADHYGRDFAASCLRVDVPYVNAPSIYATCSGSSNRSRGRR